MRVQWVVQENLGCSKDADSIIKTCKTAKMDVYPFKCIPFSRELPNVSTDKPTIFYGSVRFVQLALESKKWSPCAFFDPELFSVSHWSKVYGENWLNHGAEKTTLSQFCYQPYDKDRLFFVRPDKDLKEFQGGVWSFGDLNRWKSGLIQADLIEEDKIQDIPIWVGEPYKISREWRCFMVEGEVCSSSQYRKDGVLNIKAGAPSEVIDYAEKMALKFRAHDIFVLDVCENDGKLYVLEIGCMNSAGFYDCSIPFIVGTVSGYDLAKNQEKVGFRYG